MNKKRKQKKVNNTAVMLFTIVVVCILIIIAISNLFTSKKNVEYVGNVQVDSGVNVNIAIDEEASETERLQNMTERARIEYYVTKFINYIEAEDYDSAYSLLNSTYKKNYFATKASFETYMKTNFSKMMDIDYTNFERSGDVYVIWVTVTDAINGGPDSGKEINFVVKENDFDDFELSFSAN